MGIKSNIKTAIRSLFRRKTKNASAILAIMLGVTLLVGINITTSTLKTTFLTSLLLTQGEVDLSLTNGTGTYLSSTDYTNITELLPEALGIMPSLASNKPVMIGAQFEPNAQIAGIPLDYPRVFGEFYDWKTDEIMDLSSLLVENNTVLISSELATSLGIKLEDELPIIAQTEFTNITLTFTFNMTSNETIVNTNYQIESVNLSIVGIYNGNRPGMGYQWNSILMPLDRFQTFLSWQDPMRIIDFVDQYYVAFKTDHFAEEINEEYLQAQLDRLEEIIPEVIDQLSGESYPTYSVTSTRLIFLGVLDFVFNMMNTFLNALGLLIITTGLLLITNVQLMSVEDREFQTGVLRAVGENRQGIFRTYLLETVFQGLVGGFLGLFGGLTFGWLVAIYLAGLFGTGQFSVTPVIRTSDIVFSLIVGTILAIITGILPSIRAARVNIVEALRGIKTQFEAKSSGNYIFLGLIFGVLGVFILLQNGLLDETQWIWTIEGWDSTDEWRNIILGAGLLFSGLGIILSYFIDRMKALNLTAILLWGIPVYTFLIGLEWIGDTGANSVDIIIYAIVEIIIGSVLLVGLNLPPLMNFLRSLFIRFRSLKGVAQISPALISSHKTRSTLTFAIFAVVLTLNVTVATLVSTNFSGSVGQAEEDSRGIDLIAKLSKPEKVLSNTSYANEIKQLDQRIEDVIPFKTSESLGGMPNFVYIKDPKSPDFDLNSDVLPMRYIELGSDQIRGNASNVLDEDGRYDFYINSFPDEVRDQVDKEISDEDLIKLSRESWNLFFDSTYKMAVYNRTVVSFGALASGDVDITSFGGGGFGMGGDDPDPEDKLLDENGSEILNPIVFTDSFFLPLGLQIWLPMNRSTTPFGEFPNFQTFTVGASLGSQTGGDFPLSPSMFGASGFRGDGGVGPHVLGSIFIPERWSKLTNFFGEANGKTAFSRVPNQYDSFLLKTSLSIDNPAIEEIGRSIENYTNTKNKGYRALIDDNFVIVTTESIYSGIAAELEATTQMTSFLQIYVSFGLIIGAVGMGVISVRNVAERRREIGMMRAIGFPRSQVILSVLLELVVLGVIGLAIGVVNGLLINVGFSNLMGNDVVIPWNTIGTYLGFITLVAFIAGALPGWTAARIPPSEALRYVG